MLRSFKLFAFKFRETPFSQRPGPLPGSLGVVLNCRDHGSYGAQKKKQLHVLASMGCSPVSLSLPERGLQPSGRSWCCPSTKEGDHLPRVFPGNLCPSPSTRKDCDHHVQRLRYSKYIAISNSVGVGWTTKNPKSLRATKGYFVIVGGFQIFSRC